MIAWHYTVGQTVVRIVRSGYLEALPVVWFSARTSPEPSCCRYIRSAGRPYLLSVGEMHRIYAGWFRFGLPAGELVSAELVRERSGLPRDHWRQWIAYAKARGCDARQWFASFERVPIDRCELQYLDGHPLHGNWQTIADPAEWFSAKLDAEIAEAWRHLETGAAGARA